MQLPVTITRMQRTTTAAVPNSTSAAYAAVMALPTALATAKATDQKPATTAKATALTTQTAMAYATSLKSQDVPTQLLVTMTRMQRTTMAAVPNSTSAVCAVVTASLRARATAKATDLKPATTVMGIASQM